MQFYKTNLVVQKLSNINLTNFFDKLSASNIKDININYLFFLNPQGRYIADIFFLPKKNYIIATKNILTNLNLYLKQYDLKKQIITEDIDLEVYYTSSKENSFKDPRDNCNNILLSNDLYGNELSYYKQFRFNKKIAEFNDFEYQKSIILNFGYIKEFISNNKGCYPGQELICSIQSSGIIRKTVDICCDNDPKIIKILESDNNLNLAYKYI